VKDRLRLFGGHRPDGEAISAWLDGALDPAASAKLEAHVAACDACRARAGELRAVRASLAVLPDVEAPRSFRLTPQRLEAPAPRRAPAPSPWMRYAPAVSAAALVVFAVLLSVDITGRAGDGAAPGSGLRLLSEDGDMAAGAPAERATDGADAPPAGAIAPDTADGGAVATEADVTATAASAFAAAPTPGEREELTSNLTDDAVDATSQAREQISRASRDDDGDGGVSWLLIGEVMAAAVALVAAFFAATSFRRRAQG
jgi:hypothetical protein